MKIPSKRIIQTIFFVFSIINVVLQVKLGINYLTYIIYAFILLCLCIQKISAEEFLLYILFIPNKYLQILSIPIFLFFRKSFFKFKQQKKIVSFLIFILLSGIFNCFAFNGLLVITLFQVGFYACVFLLIVEFQNGINIEYFSYFMDNIFILQIICSVLDIIISKGIADNIRGTFESAHYLGVFLLVYLFVIYKIRNKHKNKVNTILRVISAIVIFVLADAKHVALVVAFSFIIILFLNLIHLKQQLLVLSACLLIGTTLFINFAESDIGNSLIKSNTARVYLYNENYNKKYTYIVNTYEEMKSINGLIGFGAGQYGSQISITMSKGVIYDWRPELSFYTYAIQPFKNAIANLMTERYSTVGIIISSMVLGYPLVSFVGMVAELGAVGYLMFWAVLDSLYLKKNKTFLLAFMFLTIFDTYFEIVSVFVLILYATSVCNQNNKLFID